VRVAVVSDIHGNLPALDAVIAALRPFDRLWQLGDIVGYGPQPDEVVARLREFGAEGVRGNHDAAAIGQLSTGAFNEDARAAVEWTAARIAPETRDWLSSLPEVEAAGDFTLVHGSPRDPIWEYLFSSAVASQNLASFSTPHCLVGHTHIPAAFRQDDGHMETVSPAPGSHVVLDARRAFLNPGSVGQPRDGDPRACGMMLDTDRAIAEWHRVEYPVATVQTLMEDLGLPSRLIERLSFGL
jgi:diadenosine tetraphosphatase ApaH/serine/threonine PP2A family protein phosphatase